MATSSLEAHQRKTNEFFWGMEGRLLPLRHSLAQTYAICHQYVPTGRGAVLHRPARALEASWHVRRLFAHQARGAVPLPTLFHPSSRLLQESGVGRASSSPQALQMCVDRTSPAGCCTLFALLPRLLRVSPGQDSPPQPPVAAASPSLFVLHDLGKLCILALWCVYRLC